MRLRIFVAILAILSLLLAASRVVPASADDGPTSGATPAVSPTARPTPTPTPLPPTLAFQYLWARTDDPRVRGDRPYIWGPRSIIPIISEPLAGAPGNSHDVLYYDKGRMELNDPKAPQNQWYVTSGRLVWELVKGMQQTGLKPLTYATFSPAVLPLGDPGDTTGPTYASFTARLGDPPLALQQPVAQAIDRGGKVSPADASGVTCAKVVAEAQHCIAAPFWDYLTQTGPVLVQSSPLKGEAGTISNELLFEPYFVITGLPISEAYWTTLTSDGKTARVLVQLFERRTLIYNPASSATTRVVMGNAGLHYYHWRYDAALPGDTHSGLDPAMRVGVATLWNTSPAYQYLITGLAGGRYQLIFQDLLVDGYYALTSLTYHAILIDSHFAKWDPHDLALVLAHEAQHASGFDQIGAPVNANECYAFELRSFLVDAAAWQAWYGPAGKPGQTTRPGTGGTIDQAMVFAVSNNAMLQAVRETPARFVDDLMLFYQYDCAGGGPGAAERFLTLAGLPAGIETQLPIVSAFDTFRQPLHAMGTPDSPTLAGVAHYLTGWQAVRERDRLAANDPGGPVAVWDHPAQLSR